jgi:thiol-disulfide isomerase/thioredoxin
MKQFILIVIFLFNSFSVFANLENETQKDGESQDKKTYKIRVLEEKIPAPDDIAIFNEANEKIFLEQFEGKAVLLTFWASWCAPCAKEIPDLDILKKDFRKLDIEFVTVSTDYQGINAAKQFYETNEIRNLAVFHDYKNELFKAMEVRGLPTNFIIDSDGFVRAIIEGSVNWYDEEMREFLLEYIDGNPVMPKNSFKDKSLNNNIKPAIKKPEEQNIETRESDGNKE